MPTTTVRIGTDAVVGTPTGDTGRGSGDWSPSGTSDWGNAVRSFADTPTGLIVVTNTNVAPNARVRFLLDPNDINTIEAAMGVGSIIYVQPFFRSLTFQGIGAVVSIQLSFEYPPSTNVTPVISIPRFSNWTNLSPNVFASGGGAVLATGNPLPLAPNGLPWTPAILKQLELGLTILSYENPSNNSRYGCDIIGVTVGYTTAPSAFPLSAPSITGACSV